VEQSCVPSHRRIRHEPVVFASEKANLREEYHHEEIEIFVMIKEWERKKHSHFLILSGLNLKCNRGFLPPMANGQEYRPHSQAYCHNTGEESRNRNIPQQY